MTDIVINGFATDGGARGARNDSSGRRSNPTSDDTGDDDPRTLTVEAPDSRLRDEVIPIEVSGATSVERVTLEATLTDPDGVEWRSRATFTADADGVVDPAEQPPDSADGEWDHAGPMGWLWSMTPERETPVVSLAHAAESTVHLRASASDRRAETSVTLRTRTPETTRQRVEQDGVVGTFFDPPGVGPHPGVLVLHGSGGGPLDGPAGLLAAHGYATLAVEYFGDADGIPDDLARVPVSTVRRAADWLREQPAIRDDRVGVVGWSRGGELALLAGSRYADLAPVVSYGGSGVAWDTPSGDVAWVEDGHPVPYLPGPDAPSIDGEYLVEMPADRVDAATIPVERIDGPVLLVSAGADRVWPSRELSDIAAERLTRRDFEHEFTHLTYDDAGHYVTAPYLPKTDDLFGGTPAGSARADADAWPVALETLAAGLRARDPTADTHHHP